MYIDIPLIWHPLCRRDHLMYASVALVQSCGVQLLVARKHAPKAKFLLVHASLALDLALGEAGKALDVLSRERRLPCDHDLDVLVDEAQEEHVAGEC
eukprot:1206726-Amorphochlora_amoeboformis.AAC.1